MGPEFSGKRREKECLVTKGNRAPNIVLIMADQLAPQFTGAYGHAVVKTPHIDAWQTAACGSIPPIATRLYARRHALASCPAS